MDIFPIVFFVHAALVLVSLSLYRHTGTDGVMDIRETGITEGFNLVAQHQFVHRNSLVNRWLKGYTAQWVFEIDGAGLRLWPLPEMIVQRLKVVGHHPAIGIQGGDDAPGIAGQNKTTAGFIHTNFAGQPHPCFPPGHIAVMEQVKPAPGGIVTPCPAGGIIRDTQVEGFTLRCFGLGVIDDDQDFYGAGGQGATLEGHQAKEQLRLPAGRNDEHQPQLRGWFSGGRRKKEGPLLEVRRHHAVCGRKNMYFCVSKPNYRMRDQPVQRTRVSYAGVIVSVTLVLLLMGIFGYALIYGSQLTRTLRESIHVIAELREGVSDLEADQTKAELERSHFVKATTVQLITREEAARVMKEEVGDNFEYLGLPNPYFDVITFNVRAEYMHPDSLAAIRASLRTMPTVSDVFYQENLSGLVSANMQKITWGALAAALLLIIAAITLIHNTIRLALHANRFTIKNMELVGATWGFISRPFLRRALLHGLLSSALAVAALWLIHWSLSAALPQWRQLMQQDYLILVFVLMTVMGVFIQFSSTFFVVRKYLKLRVDDLF